MPLGNEFTLSLLQVGRIAANQDDFGSCFCQAARHLQAQSAAAAGYQSSPSIQPE